MISKKIFYIMLGVIGIMIILVISTVIFGDALLKKQSKKLVELKLDSHIIESQELALAQAKKDIVKYSDLESIAKQIVPQDKDQAKATREIINLADLSGIKISSIGFPTSSLGQAVPKPTTAAPEGAAKTPAPATPTTTETQVKPVTGINGLYQLEISVVSDSKNPVTYDRLIDFLNRLEQNRRTAQVSQISIQPDVADRKVLNFSLTITLYIKP